MKKIIVLILFILILASTTLALNPDDYKETLEWDGRILDLYPYDMEFNKSAYDIIYKAEKTSKDGYVFKYPKANNIEITKDGQSLWKVATSQEIWQVEDIKETKEWAYLGNGTGIDSIEGKGDLEIDYKGDICIINTNECVTYPPVYEHTPFIDYMPNGTPFSNTISINLVNITINKNKATVSYPLPYDPTLVNTTELITQDFGEPGPADNITVSSENCGSECGGYVFDRDIGTKWLTFESTENIITVSTYIGSSRVWKYDFCTANDQWQRDPKEWYFEGSNDGGTSWTQLDYQNMTVEEQLRGECDSAKYTFTPDSIGNYTSYRFNFTDNWGATDLFQLAEIRMYKQNGSDDISCTPSWSDTTHINTYNSTCGTTDYINSTWNWTTYDANECEGSVNSTNSTINQTYACDFCTPLATNTSWSDAEYTTCDTQDTQDATQYLTQYDSNTCYDITSLPADIYANITYWNNVSDIYCNYCSYSLTTDYTDWSNITHSCGTRNATTYDTNYDNCCDITNIETDCYINDTNLIQYNYTSEETNTCEESTSLEGWEIEEKMIGNVIMYFILLFATYMLVIRNKNLHGTPFGKVFIGLITWIMLSIPFIILEGDLQVIAFASSGLGLIYMMLKMQQAIGQFRKTK